MPTCQICKYAGKPKDTPPCSTCKGYSNYEYEKPQTNADKLRAMSDGALAEFLSAKCADIQAQQISTPTATQLSALAHTWYCAWMQWLKQPAVAQQHNPFPIGDGK